MITYNYYCYNCEHGFDEMEVVPEFVGYYGSQAAYETMYYCPICHSDEISDWQEYLFELQRQLDEDEEE